MQWQQRHLIFQVLSVFVWFISGQEAKQKEAVMDALKKGQSSGSHIEHSIWFDYVENQCSFCKTKGGGRLLDSSDEWCIGSDAGEMLMAVLWCCCHWFLVWWLLCWCCCGAVWCVICLHMSSVWHFWHSVDFSSSQSDRRTDYSLTTAPSLLLTSSPIPTSFTPTTAYVFFEVVLFIYFVGAGFSTHPQNVSGKQLGKSYTFRWEGVVLLAGA